MQITLSRSELVDAISRVSRAVNANAGLVATKGIHLNATAEQLHLTATNSEVTIMTAAQAKFEGTGTRLMPARVFGDTIRAMSGDEVTLVFDEAAENDLSIVAGGASVRLSGMKAADFPEIDPPTGDSSFVDAAAFTEALARVTVAASKDQSRPILTGVLLEAHDGAITMVATDSYRLAKQELDATIGLEDGTSVLVPAAAMAEVVRLFGRADKLQLNFGERNMTVTSGDTRLDARLIAGEYPRYRQVVPGTVATPAAFNREALLEAAKRAKAVIGELPLKIQLGVDPGVCTLGGAAQDVGALSENIAVRYDGGEIAISFNPTYLIDGLSQMDADTVQLHLTEPLKPALLVPGDDNGFEYVLMPVRA